MIINDCKLIINDCKLIVNDSELQEDVETDLHAGKWSIYLANLLKLKVASLFDLNWLKS